MKKLWLWIYEYKDDDTPIGATIYDDWISGLEQDFKLPHLHPDWHLRINLEWKEEEEK